MRWSGYRDAELPEDWDGSSGLSSVVYHVRRKELTDHEE